MDWDDPVGDDDFRGKIEQLRRKLLELTSRNPLLSTKFAARSNAYVRIIGTPLDAMAYSLSNGDDSEIRLVPLPDDVLDPEDEDSEDFRDALASARETDQEYLEEIKQAESIEEDPATARQIERNLKDRVRRTLKMRPLTSRRRGSPPKIDYIAPSSEGDLNKTLAEVQVPLYPSEYDKKVRQDRIRA